MPGPIQTMKMVHAAILAELAALDAAARAGMTPEAARAASASFAELTELLERHTYGEEVGLFPKLAEREPHFADTYLRDHVDEKRLLADLATALASIGAGDAGADDDARRLAALLHHHVGAHIAKENELIIPLVEELFTPEEQGAIMGAVIGVFSPAQMARAVPWIVNRLDDDMAVAYVTALSRAMPPPVLLAAKGWIAEGCKRERVATLEERVAGFA